MENKKLYTILTAVIVVVAVLVATLITRSCDRQKYIEHTVEIHDTITDVKWDTVVEKQKEYVTLKVTDTVYQIRDSVLVLVDSVGVVIPINEYRMESIFENDSSFLKIGLTASGYDVKLDTLYYNLTYRYTTIQQPKKRNRIGVFIGPSVGVGYDFMNNRWVPAVGVSIGIGVTLKKF